MKLAITLATAALLSACASAPTDPADQLDATTPLYCAGPEQCNLMWRRAQAWVAQNSEMKIQIANDVVLETFNPPEHSLSLGYRILREPQSSRDEIKIVSICRNIWGCNRSQIGVTASFKRYVRTPS
jgi:hypothetical protein